MTNARDDEPDENAVEADILSFIIDQPSLTSLDELRREMSHSSYGPYIVDDVDRATRDLVHAGLLHRLGDFVFATRAAARYQRLPR